ncbi:unnamed protein product [Mytilus edulis]|uniref:B box-type domain-containing protein n=1 Tax=Mytilus edulis TaxID=6550 RepID=A0A8S3U1D1_MYTED|nr:unnamed protein product [Mytilus edulis]
MAQVPLQKCEICEINDGRRYCTDCEQYFCKTCEEFHLKSKACRDHVFQDLGQINPEEKGSELKDIVDKLVHGKVANVTTEEEVILQKKIEEERILKNAQKRAEMVLLKVTNAVENQGDTMLLNSHQSLQQAMQSMSDIAKSDLEFPF